jgi:hypothetical protein
VLGSSIGSADDAPSSLSVADTANAGGADDAADAASALAPPAESLFVDADALALVCFTRHLAPRAVLAAATPGYALTSAGAAGADGELGGPLGELLRSADFVVSETRARARALGAAGVVFEEETGGAAAAYEALLGAAGDVSLERAAHGAPALAHVPAACARVLRGVHALLDGSSEATAGARAKPAVRGAPDGWKVIF